MVDESLSLGTLYSSDNCKDEPASVKAVKKVEEHDMRIRQKTKGQIVIRSRKKKAITKSVVDKLHIRSPDR